MIFLLAAGLERPKLLNRHRLAVDRDHLLAPAVIIVQRRDFEFSATEGYVRPLLLPPDRQYFLCVPAHYHHKNRSHGIFHISFHLPPASLNKLSTSLAISQPQLGQATILSPFISGRQGFDT